MSYAKYSGLGGAGGGGGSGITSINGDTTAAQVIAAGTGISVATVSGTTTITNTGGTGSGTVTSVSVTTANGVSGTVATATTTPAISLTLGAITPSSVAATGAVTGSNLSGTNTGNVTLGTANGLSLAAQALSLGTASTSTTGALTSTDWNTFNSKGSGTVTAVSVASSNGFAGSSSGGATPSLTLSTSITGVLKGNGTAISAATSGTDYSAGTSALATGLLKSTTSTGALTIAAAGTDYQAPGNYITALTSDVTASGPGSAAATIANNAVTNAKAAQMAANTIKGNNTGSTANAADLTIAQVRLLLQATVVTAHAHTVTSQTLTGSGQKLIEFEVTDWDTASGFSTTSNITKYTFATAGYYSVTMNVTTSGAGVNGEVVPYILKNGSTYVTFGNIDQLAAGNNNSIFLNDTISVAASDYIQIGIYCSGATPTAIGSAVSGPTGTTAANCNYLAINQIL